MDLVMVNLSGVEGFALSAGDIYARIAQAHRMLEDRSGPGGEFTGWLELPRRMKDELRAIRSAAERIRGSSQVLVVIGAGGSILGAKAACRMLPYDGVQLRFIGDSLSPDAVRGLERELEGRDFSVNVVSKSGSTLEPAIAFRFVKALLDKRYGAQARRRIYATTDPEQGQLRAWAESEGFHTLPVPRDVGGRYSVLSAVGLLPMAAAGIDIARVLSAARQELHDMDLRSPENPAWQYAAARQYLYSQGKSLELFGYYDPCLRSLAAWWRQLFGESEGKNGIGIFPAVLELTGDLHSMGQYIQDGPRTMFETVVTTERFPQQAAIPFQLGDPDGLNYLAGRDLGEVCLAAARAVKSAHVAGGVPNIGVSVPERNEEGFAGLVCFFQLSCALSAYVSGVNPFDQPGVEAYKEHVFRALGRPELQKN